MPIERAQLERVLGRINLEHRPGQEVRLVAFSPKGFTLSFFDLPMPEGSCLDEHFTEVQFALNAQEKVDAGIVGARYDEAERRYLVEYEVIEWD